jgi:long-chain acyl-CoA synthetase
MDAISIFRRTVRREPERTFAFDGSMSITYAEADARTEAIASHLLEQGITNGERLGLSGADSVDLLLAIVGAWKAGVLPSLIDPRTRIDQLPYFVEDIDAKLVAAPPEYHECLLGAGAQRVEELKLLGTGDGPVNLHGPTAPLYLSYTSGSTGPPKGCVLRSGAVALGTACIAERLKFRRGDVLLATTPTPSSFQLVAAVLPAIHAGATIGLVSGLTAEEVWAAAREWHATVLVAYPLTLADMVNAPDATRDASLRMALSGGSPLAPRIKRDYQNRLNISLIESYGQSELGGFMALGSHDDDDRRFAGFVGRPLPDRLAYIGDADGNEVPSGKIGEVVVAEGYFAGYRNKPDANAKALAGGILHCGDLGIMDDDGYLRVLGRTGEAGKAAKRGGFLRELEDLYYDEAEVKHAAVVECRAHSAIESFVELLEGRSVTGDKLTERIAQKVPGGLRPRRTKVLDDMPRTFSGKADRMRLAASCEG